MISDLEQLGSGDACKWCGIFNPYSKKFCECGHRAHWSREECDCPGCLELKKFATEIVANHFKKVGPTEAGSSARPIPRWDAKS